MACRVRREYQDFSTWFNYLDADIWRTLRESPTIGVEKALRLVVDLGAVNLSERSCADIAAELVAATVGAETATAKAIDEMYQHVKAGVCAQACFRRTRTLYA